MRPLPTLSVLSGRTGAVSTVGLVAIAVFAWPESAVNPEGPLDRLDRRAIPAVLRPPDPPRELVAVLGQVGGPVTEELYSVAVSAGGRWIVTGSRGGTVRLHEVPSLSVRWERRADNRQVTALDVAPDGQSLTACTADGTMRRWKIDGSELSGSPEYVGPGAARSVAHAPDGRTIAIGSFGRVRLWNVTEDGLAPGEEVLIPGCQIQALAFSPDGRTLACGGGGDNAVRLLRVDGEGPSVQTVLRRTGENQVRALAFGPDRSDLAWLDTEGRGAVRHACGTISTWRIGCPTCHVGVFARDGRHLLTVHGTGRVYVWRLPRAWSEP